MPSKTSLLSTAVLLCTSATVFAAPLSVTMRDPSTIVKRGQTYWMYGTGKGIQQYSSTDLKNWTSRGQVFQTSPQWTKTAVPGNTINVFWAPDVHEWNGQYHLYYSFSTLGSNNSAIGVATSSTLEPNSWKDQGAVIVSQRGGDFNAIDPSVFTDFEGKQWMAYGSYWSGLKMFQLDPATGKRLNGAKTIAIAARPGVPGTPIEAPAIYPHDGWYYCFINWNGGARYNIRMGRSQNPTGPFLDRDGKDLVQNGGSLFLTSTFDDGTGRMPDDQVGPGHVGILKDGEQFYVSTHYEGSRFTGATTVNINRLIWDADGWPRVVLDEGPSRIVSHLPSRNVLSVRQSPTDGAPVQNTWFQNTPNQSWRLIHQGAGFYALQNGDQVLTLAEDATKAGATVTMAPSQNLDSQSWFATQNEDGTYRFQPKLNRAVSLDVAACSNADGAPVATWTSNDAICQKWSFHQR